MKYIIVFLFSLVFSFNSSAQEKPMYLQQNTPPPAVLLLADSTTKWNLKAKLEKEKPLLIMFFSPECDHCQHETEALIKNINKFKGIQIVMATTRPLWEMKAFAQKYGLNKHGITVGKDIAYVIPSYYEMKNLPYLAFYNKDKKLISTFEGSLGIPSILKAFGR
ncbi:peroxiredoxin family protein [Niabella ginsengisoli]|uniref:Thioredoxin family protein n=1 Tax=Niabella ginsengisoli TaxID=522298 RepID=A0ABS9SG91_9BACT|nr:redoxin domain-containing protein [Niabella ginsengisoli]MCH5597378.1 thioredoxin family protein [Niabella ginsengisoli]